MVSKSRAASVQALCSRLILVPLQRLAEGARAPDSATLGGGSEQSGDESGLGRHVVGGDGGNLLPKVIHGVTFRDGVEVTDAASQDAA